MPSTQAGVGPPEEHGPFGQRLGWGTRPALVIIDMVQAYFRPEAPFYLGQPEVIDRCKALLDVARSCGAPVIHTTVRYDAKGLNGGLFFRKVPALRLYCDGAETDWHETVPELFPFHGEQLVVKQYASAFAGTPLAASLTAHGVDTVVLCGVSTSGCVRATATDAITHGFRPMVVGEACADRTADIHQSNLRDIGLKSGDVVSPDEAARQLRELTSGPPG